MGTGRATQHMAAERGAAALLDGRHHLELAEAQVTALGLAPGRPVGTEDIRDLEWIGHGGRLSVR